MTKKITQKRRKIENKRKKIRQDIAKTSWNSKTKNCFKKQAKILKKRQTNIIKKRKLFDKMCKNRKKKTSKNFVNWEKIRKDSWKKNIEKLFKKIKIEK